MALDLDAVLVLCGEDADARAVLMRVLCVQLAKAIAMSSRVTTDAAEIAVQVSSTIARESILKLMAKNRKPPSVAGDC